MGSRHTQQSPQEGSQAPHSADSNQVLKRLIEGQDGSKSRSLSFPRQQRVTRRAALEVLRMQGKRVRTSSIEVRALASPELFPKAGFIVPKYGHNSVERNRLKRRLRELTRAELLPSLTAMDIVLRATPTAYRRTFAELRVEILRLRENLAALTLSPARPT